jgi:DNA polymerase/3'-5' exonuclease PolX
MAAPVNDLLLLNLKILLDEALTSTEMKDKFRAKAYRNAIKQISNLNYQLKSGVEAEKLPGVGKKIAEKIQEIIDTGILHQVENVAPEKKEKTILITTFTKIWGVGPVKANELYNAGAKSINDIKKKYTHLLNDNQLVGLKYFDDLQKRAPRSEVSIIADKILEEINELTAQGWQIQSKVCGSFRRRIETCGDMDVLLCEQNGKPILGEIVKRLSEKGVLKVHLGEGKTKYMGITILPSKQAFRIDLEVITPFEWPFALLYFTGSGPFNEKQRLIAKKKGFSLSEHGLRNVDTGEYVKGLLCELDIFNWLGMEYLPPWERF